MRAEIELGSEDWKELMGVRKKKRTEGELSSAQVMCCGLRTCNQAIELPAGRIGAAACWDGMDGTAQTCCLPRSMH